MDNGLKRSKTELLPCPFCGSPVIYVTHTRYYDYEDTVCVFCNTCKQAVILESNEAEGITETTRAKAIEAWNTRAQGMCHPEEQYLDSHSDLTVMVCSECGVPTDDLEDCNFCPNCGRKVE